MKWTLKVDLKTTSHKKEMEMLDLQVELDYNLQTKKIYK